MDLENRRGASLGLFFHHAGVCDVKQNEGTEAEIKPRQLPSSTNKYEEGFFVLGRNTSEFITKSEHTAKETVFLPEHLGHPPPPLRQ